ncbi:HAMP domain-containing sensor histidine kinase [uncultured Proteiniphilum sp.]|uniref:sensor histidine kinase n=1 Tax=uncultured Proteiniphilum sp. TaxID=497637 RepID=UPI002617E1C6|nr:HAMP domain-containing sensor histidine kinase [uncultured Proteiniphilum sp.]
MHIQSKHIFLSKIVTIVLLSLAGGWLFWQEYYFSSILVLMSIIILAVSLYYDRKNLRERIGRMIGGIRHSDFSTHFPGNRSNDELNLLMQEMNEALETFRTRTHDSVMEEAETKAWQKLISVLTHEIMNSIAPIISLSETLSEQEISEGTDPERYRIMQQAMETIHRRSKGLLSFVENYRTLTRLPQPVKQPILMHGLLQSIQQLTSSNGIDFSYYVYPTQLILNADKIMVEQLLINLLKNAHEACSGLSEEKIEVKAEMVGDKIEITVSDNGQGISPEAIDKIFIPFYSTKAHGSGIGLSLCRQIVIRHKGKISVQSDKNGTRFRIEFP